MLAEALLQVHSRTDHRPVRQPIAGQSAWRAPLANTPKTLSFSPALSPCTPLLSLSPQVSAASKSVFNDDIVLNNQYPATGHHEVVIESPQHNLCVSSCGPHQVNNLVWAWRERGECAGRACLFSFLFSLRPASPIESPQRNLCVSNCGPYQVNNLV